MKFVKSNSKKKLLILLLLSFGMTLTNLGLPLFNSLFLNNNYEDGNIIGFSILKVSGLKEQKPLTISLKKQAA